MAVSLSPEQKRHFLHSLRYLLREATYLPDPVSRSYFHSYILSRFRKYRPRTQRVEEIPYNPLTGYFPLEPSRLSKLLADCRKTGSLLRRANEGDGECIYRVLLQTYGRKGERRHNLLYPLLEPDTPQDPEAITKLLTKLEDPRNQDVPTISTAVRALARSQRAQPATNLSRTHIKHIEPTIPATNSWGRPMPVVRVRKIKRRAYMDLIERLLPPLPREEWEQLQAMATGVFKPNTLTSKRRYNPDGEQATGSLGRLKAERFRHPHVITPRAMRRLWAKVFVQCPLMMWNAERQTWDIKWGSVRPEKLIDALPELQVEEII